MPAKRCFNDPAICGNCSRKDFSLSSFGIELGFFVVEYAGSKGKFPPIKRREKKSLYIATIEKGHSLVNSLIETGRISSLGLVVVDEVGYCVC